MVYSLVRFSNAATHYNFAENSTSFTETKTKTKKQICSRRIQSTAMRAADGQRMGRGEEGKRKWMYTSATTLDNFHKSLPFTTNPRRLSWFSLSSSANLFPQFPSSSPDICPPMIGSSLSRACGWGVEGDLGPETIPARGSATKRLTANKSHNGTH